MGKSSLHAGEATPATPAEIAAARAGERLFERPWGFLKGVPSLEFLPPADRPEFAFAGRSNVGKSSLLNALVRQQGLARTSNTPGRTQDLNFFATSGVAINIVDMPGYGFAKAPKEKVDAWTRLVKDFLRGRPTLKRVFLLIDARHGIKPVDRDIMELLNEAAVSYQIVLTKADKVSERALNAVLASTTAAVAAEVAAFPEVLVTSAEKNIGIARLRSTIAEIAGWAST